MNEYPGRRWQFRCDCICLRRSTKLLLIDAGRELAASLSFRARYERETKSATSPPKFPDIHLFREAYTPHQVVKARVGAQRVKGGIDLEIDKPHIMRMIRLFQPLKRFVFFAPPGVDERNLVPAHSIFSPVPSQP